MASVHRVCWWALLALCLATSCCPAQQQQPPSASDSASSSDSTESNSPADSATPADSRAPLPDSPGALLQQQQQSVVAVSKAAGATGTDICKVSRQRRRIDLEIWTPEQARKYCTNMANPYDRFLNTTMPIPMTSKEKAYLAFRNLTDPFNLLTIVATSAFTIATDSHTGFGPGARGIGYLTGITYVQDATGEFFGTWLVPALTHEDPHYHRLPDAKIPMRALHAISRTVIAQHDDGTRMPNYATLAVYPVTSEIANLYVPGVQTNGTATTARILTGYATDPINNLITEFLPDVAKHVHVQIIFVQRILNQVATGQPGTD